MKQRNVGYIWTSRVQHSMDGDQLPTQGTGKNKINRTRNLNPSVRTGEDISCHMSSSATLIRFVII
jgi:hypothetical protein